MHEKLGRLFLFTAAILAPYFTTNAQFHHFGEHINTHLGSECALVLSGPGRSSVYDYNVNLFRGTM
ncbi:unnamed protein product [Ceratitis capitata]|uniref:(Mediterranean fruit fly) hypothetical protein n=1 Tax=Ceratitis capitata TaxID=7213 RepID=A0A811U7Z5_CERCA|nr:unnamed protein product [Ceratitis capitata]